MDRVMDRAFSRAQSKVLTEERAQAPKEVVPEKDQIQKILEDYHRRDYIRCLGLKRPHYNALDQAVWVVSNSDVSKAFRNLSLGLHPDKNPDPRAREAFDALNDAVRKLKDPQSRGEIVRDLAERDKKMEKLSWGPAGNDMQEELQKQVERAQEVRSLKKEDANDFANKIAKQVNPSKNLTCIEHFWEIYVFLGSIRLR
ncbi:hypothetical protein CYMTET_47205 [Cymbomonas tetramitiformis]|uniref:J domain-containing protein n=1 Tax=Cymbomonas tetramitiformis TaxID=36881 RepID=A0AAE0BWK6_9CHLO|nr:hypothetical protein CYMTET_47205 [Cymbomonas tetramitiformis]|eukprot:gene4830-5898_t